MSARWLAATITLMAAPAHAEEPRTLDFQGGLVLAAPPRAGQRAVPGLVLELRGYRASGLWLAGGLALEPAVDLRDPERAQLALLGAAGAGVGLYRDLGARVTALAGLRVDAVSAGAWPGAPARAHGVRLGPTASLAVVIGRAWGHPMAIEARGAWLHHRMDAGDALARWQAGLVLSGVLLPDRPR